MNIPFQIKGVTSGVVDARNDFAATFAIGQIGRKLASCGAVWALAADAAEVAQVSVNAALARIAKVLRRWPEGDFWSVISDQALCQRRRKLMA